MSAVASKYCVTTDSRFEDSIVVHLGRNQNIKFIRCVDILYYFDTADIGHMKTSQYEITDDEKTDKYKSSVMGYSFVSTAVANK